MEVLKPGYVLHFVLGSEEFKELEPILNDRDYVAQAFANGYIDKVYDSLWESVLTSIKASDLYITNIFNSMEMSRYMNISPPEKALQKIFSDLAKANKNNPFEQIKTFSNFANDSAMATLDLFNKLKHNDTKQIFSKWDKDNTVDNLDIIRKDLDLASDFIDNLSHNIETYFDGTDSLNADNLADDVARKLARIQEELSSQAVSKIFQDNLNKTSKLLNTLGIDTVGVSISYLQGYSNTSTNFQFSDFAKIWKSRSSDLKDKLNRLPTSPDENIIHDDLKKFFKSTFSLDDETVDKIKEPELDYKKIKDLKLTMSITFTLLDVAVSLYTLIDVILKLSYVISKIKSNLEISRAVSGAIMNPGEIPNLAMQFFQNFWNYFKEKSLEVWTSMLIPKLLAIKIPIPKFVAMVLFAGKEKSKPPTIQERIGRIEREQEFRDTTLSRLENRYTRDINDIKGESHDETMENISKAREEFNKFKGNK